MFLRQEQRKQLMVQMPHLQLGRLQLFQQRFHYVQFLLEFHLPLLSFTEAQRLQTHILLRLDHQVLLVELQKERTQLVLQVPSNDPCINLLLALFSLSKCSLSLQHSQGISSNSMCQFCLLQLVLILQMLMHRQPMKVVLLRVHSQRL